MARIDDEQGRPLGGLHYPQTLLEPKMPTDRAGSAAQVSQVKMPAKYGPEETVPGLICSYGAGAYAYQSPPGVETSRKAICHNSVEEPDERHHCDRCCGDYCTTHAEPAAHDCKDMILPG